SRRDNREARSKRNRGWIGRNLRQDYERIRDRAGSSERIAGLGGPGRSSADTGWLELRRPIWDDPCLGTFLFLSERWTPARPWPAVARATESSSRCRIRLVSARSSSQALFHRRDRRRDLCHGGSISGSRLISGHQARFIPSGADRSSGDDSGNWAGERRG